MCVSGASILWPPNWTCWTIRDLSDMVLLSAGIHSNIMSSVLKLEFKTIRQYKVNQKTTYQFTLKGSSL